MAMTGLPNLFISGHFKQIKVFLVCAICLLDTVYSRQSLNIIVAGHIEIGLDRGFVKHGLNFVETTGPYCPVRKNTKSSHQANLLLVLVTRSITSSSVLAQKWRLWNFILGANKEGRGNVSDCK